MTRVISSAVGAGELMARPRVGALRRFAAPTRGPAFWLTLWIAAAAAGASI